MEKKGTITIIIPAFNEGKTIGDILKRCKPYADELLVVLAKRSSDNTADIAKKYGARIIIDNGKGKGDGMKLAAKEASGDILIFIDADGSHIPEDIPQIVAPLKENKADIVLTSRMRGGSEELHGTFPKFIRMVLSDIITLIINYRFGVKITDSQNGFRGVKKDIFNSLNLKSNHTEIETEMIMKAAKKRYKIYEVPSRELERKGGESKLSVTKHGWRYLKVVLSNLI